MPIPEQDEQRLYLPEEKDISAGSLRVNYKLIWMAVFLLVGMVGLFVSVILNTMLMGVIMSISLAMIYVLFIQVPWLDRGKTTVLTKSFRVGSNKYDKMTGRSRFVSNVAEAGESFGDKTPAPLTRHQRKKGYSPKIGPVSFRPFPMDQPSGGGTQEEPKQAPLGITHDERYGTVSSTMWVAGSSLLGADSRTSKSVRESFAGILNLVAEDDMIYRLSWRVQTFLKEPQHPEALIEKVRDGAKLVRQNPPNQDVFVNRTAAMGEDAVNHRSTITLSLNEAQVKRPAKEVGGVEALLVQQLAAFYAAAMGTEGASPIGLQAATFLSLNELIVQNRLALDPVFAKPLWEGWSALSDPALLLQQQDAWPKYMNFEPDDHCKIGETYHCGFYLAGLGSNGVLPDQFWDVLKVPVPKTVTTVVQMVPGRSAQRRAEWTTTGATQTGNDRVAKDRRVTETQVFQEEQAKRQEREIAREAGQVGRVRCYVDVTGASLEEAQSNSNQLLKASLGSNLGTRFILEPLVGCQSRGIEAVIPAGRGLTTIPLPRL